MADDFVIAALKQRYFAVLRREDYPRTPQVTKEADHLEHAIKELLAKEQINTTGQS